MYIYTYIYPRARAAAQGVLQVNSPKNQLAAQFASNEYDSGSLRKIKCIDFHGTAWLANESNI